MKTPIEYLQQNGWTEFPDQFRTHARCFAKRFETPTRCNCNDDKRGMQVVIAVSNRDGKNCEIDICGELPDETWMQLKNYGMPDDIENTVAKIPRLLIAWEAMANYPIPATHGDRQARFESEEGDNSQTGSTTP
jgi:hypothetical protein